mgnify:CR=1 FL=1
MNRSRLLVLAASLLAAQGAAAQATVKEDGNWRASLGAAYSQARGNTDSSNFALQADAVRATERDKWSLNAKALYAQTDGNETANQMRAGTRYDWNLSPRVFLFGGLDLERDEVALLDLRHTVSAGAGYKVFKRPDLTWDVIGGVGHVGDRYAAPRPVDDALRSRYRYATALLGQESTHRFTETTTGKQRLVVYPNLSNTGEYRAEWDLGVAVAINKTLSLTAGFAWRYNSDPGPALRKTDTLLTTGIAMKFE